MTKHSPKQEENLSEELLFRGVFDDNYGIIFSSSP